VAVVSEKPVPSLALAKSSSVTPPCVTYAQVTPTQKVQDHTYFKLGARPPLTFSEFPPLGSQTSDIPSTVAVVSEKPVPSLASTKSPSVTPLCVTYAQVVQLQGVKSPMYAPKYMPLSPITDDPCGTSSTRYSSQSSSPLPKKKVPNTNSAPVISRIDHTYAEAVTKTSHFQMPSTPTLVLPNLGFLPSKQLYIQDNNFLAFQVPGDGNCFFHSLSLSLHGDFSKSKELRNIICGFIANNWDQWKQKLVLLQDSVITKESYINQMLNTNGWATAVEVEAASILLGCKIHVWLTGLNGKKQITYTLNTFSPPQCTENPQILQLKLTNNHFEVLRNNFVLPQAKPKNISFHIHHKVPRHNTKPVGSDCQHDINVTSTSHASVEIPQKQLNTALNSSHNTAASSASDTDKSISTNTNKNKMCRKRKRTSTCISLTSEEVPPKQNVTDLNCEPTCTRTDSAAPATETLLPSNTQQSKINSPVHSICRKFGIQYDPPVETETTIEANKRRHKNMRKIRIQKEKMQMNASEIPDAPPLSNNKQFNKAMDSN
jgi:hypothetical protein